MSQENIDSLANLLNWKYCKDLNLIVSDYFYGHERRNLIPYIYEKLDIDNRFQLAVARSHTKITLLETWEGRKFVIHGSANLRSSDNVESFCIEENAELYDFNKGWHDDILKEYSTINKSIKSRKLWQILDQANGASMPQETKQQHLNESDQVTHLQSEKPHFREAKF